MGARANIGTAREVANVSRNPWVLGTYMVGNSEEVGGGNHSVGDTDAEFLYLFPYITKEGIA